jgi:hypothetical protein
MKMLIEVLVQVQSRWTVLGQTISIATFIALSESVKMMAGFDPKKQERF